MIDTYFRTPYQKLFVDPVVKWNWFPPNALTLLSLIFGLYLIPLLAFGFFKVSLFFLLLSGYLDTLDGSVARARNIASPKGAVYDIVSDRIVEGSVILGFFLYNPEERALLCFLMLASVLICVSSFLVVGIFVENSSKKSFHYSPGIMERTEAFIFFALMMLAPGSFTFLASAFTLLVLLTAFLRVKQFVRNEPFAL